MAASPIDLTTLADVKTYLGSNVPSTADGVLQMLITAASQFVATWCNRIFASATYTERYSGTGTTRQFLRQIPVTAVASVVIDGRTLPPSTLPGQAGFDFDEFGLYAMGCERFERGVRNMTVTYTAGYTTIPADLAQAVIDMVGLKYKKRDALGISSRIIAGETIVYTANEVTASVKTVLDAYSRAATVL